VFTYGNGETVYITIENWADINLGFTTAAENVIIMDEAFYMPQLDRSRRIWLYLPPDYNNSDSSYPVIYMHDGQNLFDFYTSYVGEWEVDETLNRLFNRGHKVPIVVGIDHGNALRVDELTPWNHPGIGGGEGDEYLAFIVETLKPYIDENYRTLPDRENTGIMGSSLGGLISAYGAIKYQDIFSKSGPFSPAYWINNDSIWDYISATGYQQEVRFYQNVGEQEGPEYIDNMFKMRNSLIALGFYSQMSKVIPGASHNEQTWREDFEEAYMWLFGQYADIDENIITHGTINVFPNPANNIIKLPGIENQDIRSIVVLNYCGQVVMQFDGYQDEINIEDLKNGTYLIKVNLDNFYWSGKFIKQ
jgi:predicted alpha/beta superfamily hydrolase